MLRLKKRKILKYLNKFIFLLLTITAITTNAQEKVVDQIIGVVGSNIILQSELESQYLQYLAQGLEPSPSSRCEILEDMLFQKLLINQAQIDSVEVTEAQVESELDKRMRYFINQLGSEKALEDYLGKSILQIKADYKDEIKGLLLAQQMQSKITGKVVVTPAEVRSYFNQIPTDSLPFINSEVEVGQIVKMPPLSKEEKQNVKDKLQNIRERILKGEDFSTLAILYSEDPGSAKNGGELGFVNREDLVPEFAAVAFNLKGSEVSNVIESPYGYHILQLISRRGEQVNVRHILLTPKVSSADLTKAQVYLDSIYSLMLKYDTLNFEKAALRFSDDAETKNNAGLIINPQTGTTKFETQELDPAIFFTIDKLKLGEFSRPVRMQTKDGKSAYRILYLKSRTLPHRANLKEDYQRIQNVAMTQKQAKIVSDWVKKKKSTTYIKIDEEFKSCDFRYKWIN